MTSPLRRRSLRAGRWMHSPARRIGGLQKLAAEPRHAQAIVLGTRWDAWRLPRSAPFLERNQISFSWLTLDDPDLADHWPGPPPPKAISPHSPAARRRDEVGPAAAARVRGAPRPSDRSRAFRNTILSSLAGDRRASPPPSYGASEGLRTIVVEQEGARRPGGDVVADRELSGVSERDLGARNSRAARAPARPNA